MEDHYSFTVKYEKSVIGTHDVSINIVNNTARFTSNNKDLAGLLGIKTIQFSNLMKKQFNAKIIVNAWDNSYRTCNFENIEDGINAFNWLKEQLEGQII